MQEILEVNEVARRLKKSAATIRTYADSGKLTAIRTGRGARLFDAREVERFLKEQAARK